MLAGGEWRADDERCRRSNYGGMGGERFHHLGSFLWPRASATSRPVLMTMSAYGP
jgi:hypothetical protein